MRTTALTIVAVAFIGLSGCVRTYRAEQHTSVSTGLNSDGTASYTRQANREERAWTSPWLGQPDAVRP